MMDRRRPSRGLTLAEILWAMTMLVLMLSMALGLFIEGERHYNKTSVDLDAEREARAAMGYTEAELRQAMPLPGAAAAAPVIYPTAWPLGASPTPTSAVSFYKVDTTKGLAFATTGTTINMNNIQYDCVVIQQTPAPSPPVGTPPNPPLLQETIYNSNCTTVLSTRIIGHDVSQFDVTPLTTGSYAIELTTAPVIRKDWQSSPQPTLNTFTLDSTILISYYPTNYP
jgi:hypothetical protein